MRQSNVIKCKYCDYTVVRFKGRGNFQGKNLLWHVIDNHEKEFLCQAGFASFDDWLDWQESEYEAGEALKYC